MTRLLLDQFIQVSYTPGRPTWLLLNLQAHKEALRPHLFVFLPLHIAFFPPHGRLREFALTCSCLLFLSQAVEGVGDTVDERVGGDDNVGIFEILDEGSYTRFDRSSPGKSAILAYQGLSN